MTASPMRPVHEAELKLGHQMLGVVIGPVMCAGGPTIGGLLVGMKSVCSFIIAKRRRQDVADQSDRP
jgi:hypothetical protein